MGEKKKPTRKSGKRKATKRTPQERAEGAEAVIQDVRSMEGREGPKGGDRYEQAMRDLDIWRGYLRGMQVESLAATYSLEPRTVRGILKEMGKQARRISQDDPADIVQEYVWRVEAAVDELAAIAVKEKGNARINAVKTRLEADRHKMEVLQAVGILPEDLGTMGQRLELRAMFDALIDVVREKLPRGQADELLVMVAQRWDPAGVGAALEERHELPSGDA